MPESLQDALEAATQRRAEVRRQLATEPVRELHGLVAASGFTAARFGAEKAWTVEVVLAGWHEQGGPIRPRLTLEALASDEQVQRLKEQLPAEAVVSLRVRLGAADGEAPAQALLEAVCGIVSDDARLNELLTRLKEPKHFHYEALGAVTLDPATGLYEASTGWGEHDVKLVLPVETEHDLDAATRLARDLLADQADWHRRVLELVAEKLLAVKNSAWRTEGEAPVTAEELCSAITLTSVWVDTDGSVDFWFDAGDQFWGHDIHVTGTLEAGPTDVSLTG